MKSELLFDFLPLRFLEIILKILDEDVNETREHDYFTRALTQSAFKIIFLKFEFFLCHRKYSLRISVTLLVVTNY